MAYLRYRLASACDGFGHRTGFLDSLFGGHGAGVASMCDGVKFAI